MLSEYNSKVIYPRGGKYNPGTEYYSLGIIGKRLSFHQNFSKFVKRRFTSIYAKSQTLKRLMFLPVFYIYIYIYIYMFQYLCILKVKRTKKMKWKNTAVWSYSLGLALRPPD